MNKAAVDEYRGKVDSRLEELTVINVKHSSDLGHITVVLDKIENHLNTQNNRIRVIEKQSSRQDGIMGVMGVVFATLIGWLFKTK